MTGTAFGCEGFLVLSAQDLTEGDVVYLTSDARWSRHLQKARLFPADAAAAGDALERLTADESRVIAPSLVEVRRRNGQIRPVHFREAFRASGPTNRFLGKQADRQEADHVRLF